MNSLPLSDVQRYIEENIEPDFHARRLDKIKKLKLNTLLLRKNPYLFKAKAIITPEELIRTLLDAYFSSSEETTFGNFLEGLARFVCERVHGGWKSSTDGLDVEFELDRKRYFLAIKSGPNWGNSQQIKRMRAAFVTARKILGTSGSGLSAECINGCCYGRIPDVSMNKGDYIKLCGERFWTLISNDPTLYTGIIEPLGHKALERNDAAREAYGHVVTKFTIEFAAQYVDLTTGAIQWDKLVKFNSGKEHPPKAKRVSKKEKFAAEQMLLAPTERSVEIINDTRLVKKLKEMGIQTIGDITKHTWFTLLNPPSGGQGIGPKSTDILGAFLEAQGIDLKP